MALGIDTNLVLVAAVMALRLSILVALPPLMDNRSVPVWWRLAFALPLAWALAPAALSQMTTMPTALSWPVLALEAINSLVIGALLAFAINLVLAAVRFAGTIAGMQIGFAIVNAYDPQTDSQISIIAQFYYLLTVMLFFALDAHHGLIQALVTSFDVVPPFSTVNFSTAGGVVIKAYSEMFAIGLRASAPVVLVLLLVSATMGVIVKTAPQIHVLVVGFPVKIGVGLFVLGTSLIHFRGVVERSLLAAGDLLEQVLLALT